MSTTSPDAISAIYRQINPHLTSMRRGGIVGDLRHQATDSYHISREDIRRRGLSGTYSCACPADRDGPPDKAAAIDITLNPAEMKLVSRRLIKACEDNDPRIEPMREFIGTVNGRDVCGYNRVSTGSGTRSRVGFHDDDYGDAGHLWHIHMSVLRRYVENARLMSGLAEVIAGLPAGKLGWRDDDKAAPVKVTPSKTPAEPAAPKPKISLGKATAGMRAGGKGDASPEVKAIQAALNKWRPSFRLTEDGYYGAESRTDAAALQVYLADSPKPIPYPQTGWDAADGTIDKVGDADGILGEQSLNALGFSVTKP